MKKKFFFWWEMWWAFKNQQKIIKIDISQKILNFTTSSPDHEKSDHQRFEWTTVATGAIEVSGHTTVRDRFPIFQACGKKICFEFRETKYFLDLHDFSLSTYACIFFSWFSWFSKNQVFCSFVYFFCSFSPRTLI